MATRALLTDTERAVLVSGDEERKDKVVEQVQDRIDKRLERDLEFLREHQPHLYDSLCERVEQSSSLYSEPPLKK